MPIGTRFRSREFTWSMFLVPARCHFTADIFGRGGGVTPPLRYGTPYSTRLELGDAGWLRKHRAAGPASSAQPTSVSASVFSTPIDEVYTFGAHSSERCTPGNEMPTIKPRVAVTLEPGTHAVIDRLAELQGRSRGAVIADLLDSVTPALTKTVALLEAAREAPQQVKDGLRKVVEGVHEELVVVAGDATKQLDFLIGEMGAAMGSTPVSVTRGSGTDSTPLPQKPKQSRKRSK